MKNRKHKFIAVNQLNQQFTVAQMNKRWSLDDTIINIGDGRQKLKVLHIVDISTKCILNTLVTLTDFNASHIKRAVVILIKTLDVQEFEEKDKRLVLHTDRDTHFTSKTWCNLEKEMPKTVTLSMSPPHSPIENAVSERLNGTLKHMRVDELKEKYGFSSINDILANLEPFSKDIKFYKRLIKDFQSYYNEKHIHRELQIQPALEEQIHMISEPIIGDAPVIAARNNSSSPIEDRIAIKEYRNELRKTWADAQALRDDPNATADERLLISLVEEIIQRENKKLARLSHAQFIVVNDKLDEINEKIAQLTAKRVKKNRPKNAYPLRDPLARSMYESLLEYFPKGIGRQQMVHLAQMRIIIVVLYTTGARINEIRYLTKEDFENITKVGYLSLKQTKTNEYRLAYFGPQVLNEYKRIQNDIEYLFVENNFQFLGATIQNTQEVMNNRSWIRKVNVFLSQVKTQLGIPLQIKSHSFRIGFINNVLKKSDISQAAALVGHKSLETTKRYLRYKNSSQESRELVDDALGFSDQLDIDNQ